jgi:hypothetical protein
MGLTARKSLALEDAGLDDLFRKEKALWTEMATEAFTYTADFVKDAGEPVRPDDLISVLVPVLEVTQKLREYLAENRLRQKYWFTWFGEYIIDTLWDQLNPDEEDESD